LFLSTNHSLPEKWTLIPGTNPGSKFRKTTVSSSKNELDTYFSLEPPPSGQHIFDWWLDWWVSKQKLLPNLSQIAMKLFSIPGSAAISERTWSTMGRIWTTERNQLDPDTVRTLGFLKSNNDMW